jgi:hypothetical protein
MSGVHRLLFSIRLLKFTGHDFALPKARRRTKWITA